ncbi:MAG: hypothetical protein ABI655_11950 [Phenylobacterium sp.]
MRILVSVAGLGACVLLSACGPSTPETTAPAPKKSLSRSVTFYQGQEQATKVSAPTVTINSPGYLTLTAQAEFPAAGYANLGFLPRIYAAPPPDGVYEVDVVGDKPAAGGQVVTTVPVRGGWSHYPEARLKGVRFMAKDNDATAMLPPPAP